MAILSDTFEADLDLEVWFQQDLNPMYNFLFEAWYNYVGPEKAIEEHLQDRLIHQINQKILDSMRIEMNSVKGGNIPGMLYATNTNRIYEQKELGIYCGHRTGFVRHSRNQRL